MPDHAFQPLINELTLWQEAGLRCKFWWRDDDLVAATPECYRMQAISQQHGVYVLVAVIPQLMSATLGRDTSSMHNFIFCQHGFAHNNHALPGQPNSEYPDSRPLEAITSELANGRQLLIEQFAERLFPVLVPPWNRLRDSALSELPNLGFTGLSCYGEINRQQIGKLVCVDTHLDVVDWSTAPKFPEGRDAFLIDRLIEALQVRRLDQQLNGEPTGILTHHRAMDDNAWRFMEQLLQETQRFPCVEWLSPRELFASSGEKGLKHTPIKDFRTRHYEVEATLHAGSRTHVIYQKAISAINPVDIALLQQKYQSQLESFDYHGDFKYADIPLWVAHKAARAVSLALDEKPQMTILDIGVGAGHFAAVCNSLGHKCIGIDIENSFYDDMCKLFKVDRRLHRVERCQNLPDLGEKFDLVTIMWQSFDVLSYNADGSRDYFSVDDWAFLFQDLIKCHLKPHGQIYLELNKKKFKDGSQAYDDELPEWCRQQGAAVDQGRGTILFSELASVG